MRICLMSAIRSEMLGRKKIPEFYPFLLVRMLEISKSGVLCTYITWYATMTPCIHSILHPFFSPSETKRVY
jgi:hypothetical protein